MLQNWYNLIHSRIFNIIIWLQQLTEAEEREVLDNLVSYIIARKVLGLHSPETMYEMQKKRSYWKLCAVNAVSCFGKK